MQQEAAMMEATAGSAGEEELDLEEDDDDLNDFNALKQKTAHKAAK